MVRVSTADLKEILTKAQAQTTGAKVSPTLMRGLEVLMSPQQKRKKRVSAPEENLARLLTDAQVSYVREYQFHSRRRWRADFALPAELPWLLVEVEGGIWTNGGHVRGAYYEENCEKYAEALMEGFLVLRVTPRQINNGKALAWIQRAVMERTPQKGTPCPPHRPQNN